MSHLYPHDTIQYRIQNYFYLVREYLRLWNTSAMLNFSVYALRYKCLWISESFWGFVLAELLKSFFMGGRGVVRGWRHRCRMNFREYDSQIQSCDRNLRVAVTKSFNFLPLFHIPVIKTPMWEIGMIKLKSLYLLRSIQKRIQIKKGKSKFLNASIIP